MSDLQKLSELHDKGILSDEEFEAKKKLLSPDPVGAAEPPGLAPSLKKVTPAWKTGSMVGLVFLAIFVPIAGFIVGIVGMAKGGKRTGQGVALFILSILVGVIWIAAIGGSSSSTRTASTTTEAAKPAALTQSDYQKKDPS